VLRAVSGTGADVLRVHEDVGSDLRARAAGADAVTTGRDVHLRAGRGRPDEPAGLALLAHEATHVTAALDPAAGARRSRPGGPAAEEAAARAAEARAADVRAADVRAMRAAERSARGPDHRQVPPHGPHARTVPQGPSAAPPGAVPHASAMTAAVDRELPAPVPFDVEELRRGLVEDLMRQLRSEFERGA
jgi:hypothetical protein